MLLASFRVCSVHGFTVDVKHINDGKTELQIFSFSPKRLKATLQAKGIILDFKARFIVILLKNLYS